MSKRAADKQLTQLSAAQEDDSDDDADQPAGTWQSASADVLAQRRIVKAHRPSTSSTAPASNPFAKAFLVPAAAAAPAAADGGGGGGGGCAWGLSSKQAASFAMPPIQTSKPPPPPAACASGFFGGGGGCAWSTGGGGFGAVASCAPSFSSLAAAPAAAKESGTFASSGALGGAFGALGQKPADKADADGDDDGDGGGADDDPTAHEVAIVSEPKLPIVATVTGEEDEACVHRVRAKVFVLESAPPPAAAAAAAPAADEPAASGGGGGALSTATRWVERGVGTLHLNVHRPKPHVSASAAEFVPGAPAHAVKGGAAAAEGGARKAKTRPPRLVMRVEHVGRLILNTPLLAEMPPPSRVSETSVRVNSIGTALGEVAAAEDGTPPPFQCLLRVKTAPEAEALMQALAQAIDAHVRAASA